MPPAVTLRFDDVHVGMVVTGKVKAVTDFGVFVRLDGGDRLDVLCHTTELSDHKVGNIGLAFAVGTAVKVAIIKVGQLRAARVDAPIHRTRPLPPHIQTHPCPRPVSITPTLALAFALGR